MSQYLTVDRQPSHLYDTKEQRLPRAVKTSGVYRTPADLGGRVATPFRPETVFSALFSDLTVHERFFFLAQTVSL